MVIGKLCDSGRWLVLVLAKIYLRRRIQSSDDMGAFLQRAGQVGRKERKDENHKAETKVG